MALQTFTAGQILTAAQQNALQANDYNWTVSNKTASYTLTAADKGTRVVMSNAGATTITVKTGLFSAGDTLFIQNIGAGTCTITAGTATVTTASSLALAQWGGGTLYFTSASAAMFFSQQAATYGLATGGTSSSITVSGVNYTMLAFTADATMTVSRSGLFDLFLVAGCGGATTGGVPGGGGAGGVLQGTVYLNAGSIPISIGAGGSGFESSSVGFPTSVSNVISAVGGGGGGGDPGRNVEPMDGGSGGGTRASGYGGVGVAKGGSSQGNSGGLGNGSTQGGGGGGAGAAGATNAGGNGISLSTFTGGTVTSLVAGGGAPSGGTAGTGGGGASGASGTANTGGGCGAGGGNGGSGIAYIRFKV